MPLLVALGFEGPGGSPTLNFDRIENWAIIAGAVVIGACIVMATIVTVRGAMHRHRVRLALREEERLDRTLPTLRDTRYFLSRFLLQSDVSPPELVAAFVRHGFGVQESPKADVGQALPAADQVTRERVEGLLSTALAAARRREQAHALIVRIERLDDPDGWAPGEYAGALANIDASRGVLQTHTRSLNHAMEAIEAEVRSVDERISALERRLELIRAEIARHFARK